MASSYGHRWGEGMGRGPQGADNSFVQLKKYTKTNKQKPPYSNGEMQDTSSLDACKSKHSLS